MKSPLVFVTLLGFSLLGVVTLCDAAQAQTASISDFLLDRSQPGMFEKSEGVPSRMGTEKSLCQRFVRGDRCFHRGQFRVAEISEEGFSDTRGEDTATAETAVGLKIKSPAVAGLLGGLVGFGAGQYYCKRWITGTLFLVVDGLATFMVVGGISAVHTGEDADSVGGVFAGAVGGAYLLGIGAVALAGSHVVQAITGPVSAHSYNKKIKRTQGKWSPFFAQDRDSWRAGIWVRF